MFCPLHGGHPTNARGANLPEERLCHILTRMMVGIMPGVRAENPAAQLALEWDPVTTDLPETPLSGPENPGVETPRRWPRATILVVSLAILLATVAVYSPAFRFGFATFDDPLYIIDNQHLRDGLALRNLRWVFLSFSPDYWFPVTRLSLILDYKLFALQAGWYHAENIVLHGISAMLLFGFLRRAVGCRALWPCAFVAFVFALHPLHVESVVWVSERKDVLCGLFWFAALWAWLRYAERPTAGRYAAALAWFGLGLMSKPMIVTLPFLLVLMDIWPLRRVVSWKLVIEKVPFAALSCAVMGMTYLAQQGAGAMMYHPPLALRLENALVTIPIFIAHTFWPVGLSVLYPYPASLPLWQVLASAAGILSVSALVLRHWRDKPYLAVGWFWYLGSLVPVLGIVQVGLQARTDHFMYVPLVGLSVIVAWGVADFITWLPAARPWCAGLAAAACLSMALLTIAQTQYWATTEGLFRRAIELDSRNYLAWDHVGQTLAGHTAFPSEVISCYRNALRIRPDFVEAHTNLAIYLCDIGRTAEGIAEYQEALRLGPDLALTHYNFGVTLARMGVNQEAINELEITLELLPSSVAAHGTLGTILVHTGHLYEGIAHLEQAVRMEPDDTATQFNLGRALAEAPGRSSAAIDHLSEALRIDPRNVPAHLSLAAVLLKTPGRRKEALAHLETALEIEPNAERRKRFDELRADHSSE